MEKTHTLRDIDVDSEAAPFLPRTSEDVSAPSRQPSNPKKRQSNFWCTQFLLILFYTAISTAIILSFHEPASHRRQKALPDLRTQLIPHQNPLMRQSPYIGPPSPSTDQAWSTLLSTSPLRVSPSELTAHNTTSIPLPNGGHLAWLGLFHELHCVKVLRHMVYREHYHGELSEEGLREKQVHADHCVDLLRESVMCHGDTETLTTFLWKEGWGRPLLSPRRAVRGCLDWGVLVGSLGDRGVSEGELDGLRNPL